MRKFAVRSIAVCLIIIAGSISLLHAQLSTEQRLHDFQNLVALYAKRYAPYEWKRQIFGFDLYEIKPWLERVRNAKDDLEFFEIQAEYVAKLDDIHSGFQMGSSFAANLGMTVDIFDGKVLIDSINRVLLPAARYPFQIGDEVVSVDGKSSEDWITMVSKWRMRGNPSTSRRVAAGQITLRNQVIFPRAVEIGSTAEVVIRLASGTVQTFIIPWTKTGVPVFTVGPVPTPKVSPLASSVSADLDSFTAFDGTQSWKLRDDDPALQPVPWAVDAEGNTRSYVLGYGARLPHFRAGLPGNFVQRLGLNPADFHFSGTYQANGLRIGFLRFPNFGPPPTALNELNLEIDFLEKNTDALVIDVTRNTGGGCYMLDAAARFLSEPFYFFGEQVRATQGLLNSYQAQADLAVALNLPDWIVNGWQFYADQIRLALNQNRGLTSAIPNCRQVGSNWPPLMHGNPPAQIVYTKPLIVLIDEFSTSAGDIFPAMLRDNDRGPLVGARSNGGGGSTSGWPTGFYSESVSTNTNSLVVRKDFIRTEDFPLTRYIENVGARPDFPLESMTRENLLNGGRTYVEGFTKILTDWVAKHTAK
jgi:C-terminal processing protease CtpA/Prc